MKKAKAKTAPKAKPAKTTAKPAKPKLKAKPAPATRPAKPESAPPRLAKTAAASLKAAPVAAKSIMESAQHIWLAGLGAFAKAQGEGTKLFDALVKEGTSLEQKTRKIATGAAGEVRGAVETGAAQVRERTQETWDRLEQVFENRVSKALAKLGVPGRKELEDLMKRVEELSQQVRRVGGGVSRSSLGQVIGNTMRRARDDLSDLARELEEAQLAAKSAKRTKPAKR